MASALAATCCSFPIVELIRMPAHLVPPPNDERQACRISTHAEDIRKRPRRPFKQPPELLRGAQTFSLARQVLSDVKIVIDDLVGMSSGQPCAKSGRLSRGKAALAAGVAADIDRHSRIRLYRFVCAWALLDHKSVL
jgi:hypothetical protein